jgi:hypothetical protein
VVKTVGDLREDVVVIFQNGYYNFITTKIRIRVKFGTCLRSVVEGNFCEFGVGPHIHGISSE